MRRRQSASVASVEAGRCPAIEASRPWAPGSPTIVDLIYLSSSVVGQDWGKRLGILVHRVFRPSFLIASSTVSFLADRTGIASDLFFGPMACGRHDLPVGAAEFYKTRGAELA